MPDSLSDVNIRLADVVEDLATSPDPYISHIDYQCQSPGMQFYLKAKISNISLPDPFHVSDVAMYLNFTDFHLPSDYDTYRCQILYAAHSETNRDVIDLGELKYVIKQFRNY